MKIGILTFHWANNYGAVIQCYALLSKLKELGHDAYVIDRVPRYSGILRRLYHKYSYNHKWSWLRFSTFSENCLNPKTRCYTSDDELKAYFANEKFDAVIVGSDQVWRWKMIGLNYFFDFIDSSAYSTKKYSYAASFGLSEWNDTDENTAKIKQLLHQFNCISVRENTAVEICKNVFNVKAQVVLDPTLLHESKFYEQVLLTNFNNKPSGKVVSYILGKQYKQVVKDISVWAKQIGLKHKNLLYTSIDMPLQTKSANLPFMHISPLEWLNEIRNAEYVITNSFHATVFCILFKKKFVVIENPQGGNDRIDTLLGMVKLTELSKDTQFLGYTFRKMTEDTGLVEMRNKSIEFLKNL